MWCVIQLTLPGEGIETAEALLQLAGALAVTLTDAGDTPLLEPAPGETPLWPRVCLEALFEKPVDEKQLGRRLSAALGDTVALRLRGVEDSDWQNAWRQHWQPLRFGNRLAVLAEDDAPGATEDVVVRLTPGLAFGTGQHPTTAMCLQWLVDHDLTGTSVCDYGTGSGLLAIAAIKLGAGHAYAVDIDPQALTACDQNARNNGVRDALTIGLPQNLAHARADILVANILSAPLCSLAEQFSTQIKPKGHLVLSGILDHQANDVVKAYQSWFEFETPMQREGWVRLTAQARP